MTWDEIMQEVETIEASRLYCVYIHSNCCTIQHIKFNSAKRPDYYFNESYADTKKEAVILAIERFKKYIQL